MSTALQTAPAYPFHLDGPLCPLLNHAEVLAEFYAEDSLRHGIKNFCKKTAWPGKPVVSFAINPEKLQELLLSLFSKGLLSGTTHTCLGQEFCQMSVVRALHDPNDAVFSNHRNHGHFLTYSGHFTGLIAEIMGRPPLWQCMEMGR